MQYVDRRGQNNVLGAARQRQRPVIRAIARIGDWRSERVAGRRAGGGGNGKDGYRARARVRGGAGGQGLVGIDYEQVHSAHGDGQGVDSRRIHGVLRIEFSVVADDELDDGVVVLIDHIEVRVVGGDGFGHGVATAGRKGRGGNLAHKAGLRVDLEDVDLAVVVWSRGLG